MQYKYNKLRGRIIEKYGNYRNFANVLGLSENSTSKKLNCKSGFSQEDIEQWSKLLDIAPSDYGVFYFA